MRVNLLFVQGGKFLAALLAVSVGIVLLARLGAEPNVPNRAEAILPMLDRLETVKTARGFTQEAVPDADIKRILLAGINAPSGHNRQPWHFTVVTDSALLDEIDTAAGKPKTRLSLAGSPLAIIISADDTSAYAVFDCGTAADRMATAAFALGYGTKIVATPASVIAEKYQEKLGIDEIYRPIAVLLIGVENPDADAVTAPTTRSAFDEKVNFVR